MSTTRQLSKVVLSAFLALLSAAVFAAGWTIYQAKPYGFSMLIPQGAKVTEHEWGGGWGGLSSQFEGVRLYGQAKLGAKESDDDIEKYALRVIGIPASAWTQIDSGRNQRGWERYRTFSARQGAKLVFGGYGVGRQGNYLLYIETTPEDFQQYRSDYDAWYASIRLE